MRFPVTGFAFFRFPWQEQRFAEQKPKGGKKTPEFEKQELQLPLFSPMIYFAVAAVRGSCCGRVVFFSGYVQIRQPDPERLLPQRGSDGPETPGDGKNQLPHWVLDAKTTKFPSGLYMFSYLHLQAATHFRNSLMKLMEILMSKEPSYVRCIKPNDAKQPGRSERIFFSLKHKMKSLMSGTKLNFNAIISNTRSVQKAKDFITIKERNLKIKSPCSQLNSELCFELQ